MGGLLIADCSNCGLTKGIRVGSTRWSHARKHKGFPALCKTCNELVEANVWKEPFVCTGCHGTDLVVYGYLTRDPQEITKDKSDGTEGHHLCPGCNQHALTFQDAGILTD